MTLIGERRQHILSEACRNGFFDISGEGDRKSAVSLHMDGYLARDPKVGGRFYPTSAARDETGVALAAQEADGGRLFAVARDPNSIDASSRLRDLDEKTVLALVESFRSSGQQTPIIVYGRETDAVVRLGAGGHRLEASRRLGVPVLCFHNEGDELDRQLCEIDENLIRADLTPSDRALFLARRKEIYLVKHPDTAKGVAGGKARHQSATDKMSFAASTAEATGQDERTIRRDVERGEKISTTALQLLRSTSHNKGVVLDKLKRLRTAEAQEQFVRDLMASDKAIAAKSKEIRTIQQASNRESRLRMVSLIAEHGRKAGDEMPRAAYPIGYADPPWEQEAWSDETGQDKGLRYPSMTVEAIKTLCAGDKSPFTRDAVLLLWVTANRLPDGLAVLEAWGFQFVTSWVWDKVNIGMGRWSRDRHEVLLIGKRGSISLAPLPGTQPPSLYSEPKTEHSRKPVWYAEQIDKLWPNVRKLELFQRKASLNESDIRLNGTWDFWGNQAGAPEGGAE